MKDFMDLRAWGWILQRGRGLPGELLPLRMPVGSVSDQVLSSTPLPPPAACLLSEMIPTLCLVLFPVWLLFSTCPYQVVTAPASFTVALPVLW